MGQQTWAPIIAVKYQGMGHKPNTCPSPALFSEPPGREADTGGYHQGCPSKLAGPYRGYLSHLPTPLGMPSPSVLIS